MAAGVGWWLRNWVPNQDFPGLNFTSAMNSLGNLEGILFMWLFDQPLIIGLSYITGYHVYHRLWRISHIFLLISVSKTTVIQWVLYPVAVVPGAATLWHHHMTSFLGSPTASWVTKWLELLGTHNGSWGNITPAMAVSVQVLQSLPDLGSDRSTCTLTMPVKSS